MATWLEKTVSSSVTLKAHRLSEFRAEDENGQKHQLMLFVDDCLLPVAMFELECVFFFWSMKLFIRIVFSFLCKYIYFDVK